MIRSTFVVSIKPPAWPTFIEHSLGQIVDGKPRYGRELRNAVIAGIAYHFWTTVPRRFVGLPIKMAFVYYSDASKATNRGAISDGNPSVVGIVCPECEK